MNLTEKQKEEVCDIIGDWYIEWKEQLVDYKSKTHRLGFAKEDLKNKICGGIK